MSGTYKIIASQFPQNFPYKDFMKLNRIYARSDIETKLKNRRNAEHYNFITHPNFPGYTFFVGYGNNSIWISLNLIEDSDKVFLHTPLKDTSANEVSEQYAQQGFKGQKNLYEVGLLTDSESKLIKNINDILNRLK